MIEKVIIRNMHTGKEMGMDKDGDGQIVLDDNAFTWGEVKINQNTYRSLSQIGNSVSSQSADSRVVTIVGWLYGDEKTMNRNQVKLSLLVAPFQLIRVIVGDWYIDGYPQTQVQFGDSYETNNDVMRKFAVSLMCANPLFTKVLEKVDSFYEERKTFSFPFYFGKYDGRLIFGKRSINVLKEIKNNGVSEVGAVITIVCMSETCANPKIYKVYEPESKIVINKTLVFGEKVIIDTRLQMQSIVGELNGVEEDYFRYWDFENDWIKFSVGVTSMAVSSDTDGATLDVEIRMKESAYVIEGM